jgi:hypothetical protein
VWSYFESREQVRLKLWIEEVRVLGAKLEEFSEKLAPGPTASRHEVPVHDISFPNAAAISGPV